MMALLVISPARMAIPVHVLMTDMGMFGPNAAPNNRICFPRSHVSSSPAVQETMDQDEPEERKDCPACGAKQAVVTEVRAWSKYAREHPRTRYLRCEQCGQVQVVEE